VRKRKCNQMSASDARPAEAEAPAAAAQRDATALRRAFQRRVESALQQQRLGYKHDEFTALCTLLAEDGARPAGPWLDLSRRVLPPPPLQSVPPEAHSVLGCTLSLINHHLCDEPAETRAAVDPQPALEALLRALTAADFSGAQSAAERCSSAASLLCQLCGCAGLQARVEGDWGHRMLRALLSKGCDAAAASAALQHCTSPLQFTTLLQHGADPDVQMQNSLASNLLQHWAATCCIDAYPSMVSALLPLVPALRAQLNSCDARSGHSPLLLLLESRQQFSAEQLTARERMAELLLQAGADVTRVDEDGNGAIHYAAVYMRSIRMVRLLMQHGCDINQRSQIGESVLHALLRRLLNTRNKCARTRSMLEEMLPLLSAPTVAGTDTAAPGSAAAQAQPALAAAATAAGTAHDAGAPTSVRTRTRKWSARCLQRGSGNALRRQCPHRCCSRARCRWSWTNLGSLRVRTTRRPSCASWSSCCVRALTPTRPCGAPTRSTVWVTTRCTWPRRPADTCRSCAC
jgi:hypothetical protein